MTERAAEVDGSRDARLAPPRAEADADADARQDRGTQRRLTAVRLLQALVVYAASRAVAFAAVVVGTRVRPDVTLSGAFEHWDAAWYLKVADHGYPHFVPEQGGQAIQSELAFFPVFPMLVRALHAVTGLSVKQAGVVVALLAGAVAVTMVWLLVDRISGPSAAHRAVAAFAFFPASFAILLPFAEGLAIACSAACLLFLMMRRWLLAGILAATATATRPTSIVLVLCCGWAAASAVRHRREWRALVAPALAPLGLVAFFLFIQARTGELGAWFRVEREGWGQSSDFGLTTLRAVRTVVGGPLDDLNALAATLALGFAVCAVACLVRWRPPDVVTVYSAGVLFLALTSGIASRPRYMLSAFPLVAAVGVAAAREWSFALVIGVSATLLGCYALVSTVTEVMVF